MLIASCPSIYINEPSSEDTAYLTATASCGTVMVPSNLTITRSDGPPSTDPLPQLKEICGTVVVKIGVVSGAGNAGESPDPLYTVAVIPLVVV